MAITTVVTPVAWCSGAVCSWNFSDDVSDVARLRHDEAVVAWLVEERVLGGVFRVIDSSEQVGNAND